MKEVFLFLRERFAVFEVFDGLFREKFVETRDHGDARLERSVDGRRRWRRQIFEQLAGIGLGPEEFAAFGVGDDAGKLLVDARAFDVGGNGLRLGEQMLEPAGAAGVGVARPGVDGFGKFVELGGEEESLLLLVSVCKMTSAWIVREALRFARGNSLLEIEQFPVCLRGSVVDQALLALAGPIDIVGGGPPAGFAFDAVFEIDDELRLAEVVGEALVDLGGADMPEGGLRDLRAVLEVFGTEDLDVQVMLGEIADERKFFLPRLVDFHGVGIELHAVAGERPVFLEEAGEEFSR